MHIGSRAEQATCGSQSMRGKLSLRSCTPAKPSEERRKRDKSDVTKLNIARLDWAAIAEAANFFQHDFLFDEKCIVRIWTSDGNLSGFIKKLYKSYNCVEQVQARIRNSKALVSFVTKTANLLHPAAWAATNRIDSDQVAFRAVNSISTEICRPPIVRLHTPFRWTQNAFFLVYNVMNWVANITKYYEKRQVRYDVGK